MISAPRGTQDFFGDEAARLSWIEETFRRTALLAGYSEIRTPLFEEASLFERGVGEGTDIVTKEMYVFEDKGGRKLALRPEGTAPVVRAILEHDLLKTQKQVKLFYAGPMFRYERPQAGRYRQFHQVGVEYVGSPSPVVDMAVILLSVDFLRELGLSSFTVKVNNVGTFEDRANYLKDLQEFLRRRTAELDEEDQPKVDRNPFRVLDSKKPKTRDVVKAAPRVAAYLSKESVAHVARVMDYLKEAAPHLDVTPDPYLVRGLDYYTRTVYEVTSPELGAQDALLGGGRYDRLFETFGGPPAPAFGFAAGVERLLLALRTRAPERPPILLYFVPLDDEALKESAILTEHLRERGLPAQMDYDVASLKSGLRHANKSGFKFAFLIGPEELLKGQGILKRLSDGAQWPVSLNADAIAEQLKLRQEATP